METKRKTRIARVLTNKMEKTVIVAVETLRQHPLYKKTTRRVVKFKVHDKNSECKPGDIVRIIETRPLSKEKHWRVAEVITRGEAEVVKPVDIEPVTVQPEKPAETVSG